METLYISKEGELDLPELNFLDSTLISNVKGSLFDVLNKSSSREEKKRKLLEIKEGIDGVIDFIFNTNSSFTTNCIPHLFEMRDDATAEIEILEQRESFFSKISNFFGKVFS